MTTLRCPACRAPIEVAAESAAGRFACGECRFSFSRRPTAPGKPAGVAAAADAAPRPGGTQQMEVVPGVMGVVYLGRQRELDRPVAIKFTRACDPDALARFAREGRVLARLAHPNLVQVYEASEEDGRPYLISEYVEGESLSKRLARESTLELGAALEIGRQVAAGLRARPGDPAPRPEERQYPDFLR